MDLLFGTILALGIFGLPVLSLMVIPFPQHRFKPTIMKRWPLSWQAIVVALYFFQTLGLYHFFYSQTPFVDGSAGQGFFSILALFTVSILFGHLFTLIGYAGTINVRKQKLRDYVEQHAIGIDLANGNLAIFFGKQYHRQNSMEGILAWCARMLEPGEEEKLHQVHRSNL